MRRQAVVRVGPLVFGVGAVGEKRIVLQAAATDPRRGAAEKLRLPRLTRA